jgi:MYXO-CTERM domain-containing protein
MLRKRPLSGFDLTLATALLSAGVVGLDPPARAQTLEQVKPYIMLVFDTSGSMLWPVCSQGWACNSGCTSGNCSSTQGCAGCFGCNGPYADINGDNSKDCPGKDVSCSLCNTLGCGNGVPDDSRLFKVKKGAYNVVSAFGEVTFALARFHQTPATFTCDAVGAQQVGGWSGAISACKTIGGTWACCTATGGHDPMGSGENRADVLVGFSDNNQSQVLSWMNNCDDYPSAGSCPGSNPPTTGCSLCPTCGGGCDLELRGSGNTPLAGSLYTVRQSLNSTIASDPLAACRPYRVILLTDGLNNCAGDPVQQAQLLYTNPTRSVPVHVIGFASAALKPNLDQIAAGGGTGSAVVVDNEVSLALAMANIISGSILKEKCNGIDDNCNNLCDEDWPEVAVNGAACTNKHAAQTCTAGVGICQRNGVYQCKPDGTGSVCNAVPGPPNPGGEICYNGLDDNCDGAIDEGCLPCVPQPEICDGKDNDCDKQVDEGYVPVPCGSSIGQCKQGTTACVNGAVVCNGATGPSTELCDNLDNNCDTIIDNFSEPCYPPSSGCDLATGVCKGVCKIGSRLCTAGKWSACVGYQGPTPEVCNGLDDDCDGLVDDGVSSSCMDYTSCTPYSTCASCPPAPMEICDGKDNDCNGSTDETFPEKGKVCGSSVGECKPGTWACENGKLVCKGGTLGVPEVCDGKDNDCNGKIDDNASGVGESCWPDGVPEKCQTEQTSAACGECKPGKTECTGGKLVCAGGLGPKKELCDGKDNDCNGLVDDNAECPAGSTCMEGQCVMPCGSGEFSCPGGTTCVGGWCVPDPCAKLSCKPTERCILPPPGSSEPAKCVEKCANVTCNEHEKCEPTSGRCVDDSCLSKGCPDGEACVGFVCVPDPCPPGKCPDDHICTDGKCYPSCLNVNCKAGETCSQGKCVKNPCEGYPCDSGFVCKAGPDGKPGCVADPCLVVSCPKGERCHDGQCVKDPCALTRCPEGLTCEVNWLGEVNCIGKTPTSTTQLVATGGGGCACDTAGVAGDALFPGLALLLLFGLVLRGRRRP